MRKQNTGSKNQRIPRKAVTPLTGVTAFFCSTRSTGLTSNVGDFLLSPHFPTFKVRRSAFLPNTHYFRRSLAKYPMAAVVKTEGQKEAPQSNLEVAV